MRVAEDFTEVEVTIESKMELDVLLASLAALRDALLQLSDIPNLEETVYGVSKGEIVRTCNEIRVRIAETAGL